MPPFRLTCLGLLAAALLWPGGDALAKKAKKAKKSAQPRILIFNPDDAKARPTVLQDVPLPAEVSDAPVLIATVEKTEGESEEHEEAKVEEKKMMLDVEGAKDKKKGKKKKTVEDDAKAETKADAKPDAKSEEKP